MAQQITKPVVVILSINFPSSLGNDLYRGLIKAPCESALVLHDNTVEEALRHFKETEPTAFIVIDYGIVNYPIVRMRSMRTAFIKESVSSRDYVLQKE
jgi:hypothetical protein